MRPLSENKQTLLLFLLATCCLMPGLGLAPLFLEEPRRALVAMEMLHNNDFIHTTIHGQPYYNKPPLFNWIIAAGFKVFGYHEWILRGITVVSHLLTGMLVWWAGKKYFSPIAGLLAAALYLAGADILYYFSLLGEIDVFFSLLVVAGWIFYFHFGRQQQWFAAFGLLYAFMALAFLTKGLPALLFLGFSLLAWQLYTRQLRALFSPAHLLAMLLFALIIGLYLYPFVRKGDFDTLIATFWSQSIERTDTDAGIGKRVSYMLGFPFMLLKDIFPGALLLLAFSWPLAKDAFRSRPLFAFSVIILAANIWVYWVSPDSRSRYHYMFHPLLLLPMVWLYAKNPLRQGMVRWVEKIFSVLPVVLLVVLLAAMAASPWVAAAADYRAVLAVAALLGGICFWAGRRYRLSPVLLTVLMMLCVRLAFGYITWQQRAAKSMAATDKASGTHMAALIQKDAVFMFDSTRISTTISYYLQRDLQRVVPYSNRLSAGTWYIMPDSVVPQQWHKAYGFTYQEHAFALVRDKAKP